MKVNLRKHPYFIQAALLILIYLFSFSLGEQRVGLYTNYAYMLGTLFAVIFMFYLFKKRYIHVYYELFYIFILIQIATLVFGFINGGLSTAIVNSGHQMMFFIVFIGLVKLYKLDEISAVNILSEFIIIVSTLSLVFGFYGYIFGNFSFGPFKYDVTGRSLFRMRGWYSSANYLGPVLALGSVTIMYKLFSISLKNNNQWLKINYILLLIITVIGLILTGSKGSYLAFIGGVFILLLSYSEFKLSMVKKTITWVTATFISFWVILYSLSLLGIDLIIVADEIVRMDSLDRNLEGGERIGLYIAALNILSESSLRDLLFGHGFTHFFNEVGLAAHSGYIEVLIERGLIIFVLLMLMLFILVHKSFKLYKIQKIGAFYLALLVVIILKNFTNMEFPSNNFPGIILIFITAIFTMKNPRVNDAHD